MTDKTTNITKDDEILFAWVRDKGQRPALLSCFFEGKPAVAIAHVEKVDKDYVITPLYLAVTPEIAERLLDHDGSVPTPNSIKVLA